MSKALYDDMELSLDESWRVNSTGRSAFRGLAPLYRNRPLWPPRTVLRNDSRVRLRCKQFPAIENMKDVSALGLMILNTHRVAQVVGDKEPFVALTTTRPGTLLWRRAPVRFPKKAPVIWHTWNERTTVAFTLVTSKHRKDRHGSPRRKISDRPQAGSGAQSCGTC
jgi:hypothetical protein